ncbi:helix-turn-helix transcriptional regulator [Enterocloster sp.]|uniref:helix-turn-helix domain-containing protein n=1 Tax=Enterocloster sp. TaxID=2719315 RepID=UPI00308058DA
MLINTKCERCNEPTKHVVGFWDGENGKSGFVHDCENEKCEVRQLIKDTETKAMQERFRIQNLNSRKRMYAGYIAALRKDAKISMMEMSKIAGCSPAEYSAYEHERKPFDEEAYKKCEEYLLKNEKKYNASGLSVSERLLLLDLLQGNRKTGKNWNGGLIQ